jgi:hypothetical protein
MALHYNLSKVHALSDGDNEFVMQIIDLFLTEIPEDLKQVKFGIEEKDYTKTHAFAHKIKPTLDLMGMNLAFEEILLVEAWTRKEGKRKEIKDTYKSIKLQVQNAFKEIKEDFNL